ncbi:MAG: DNA replication and repair protein RecF [Pseudomonadota bacterium]
MALFQGLEISGFRNLRDVQFQPHPKLNFFAGANGAGKTAVLEAIHYLVRGKSFRSVQPQDLIGRDAEQLLVRASLKLEHSDHAPVEAAVLRPRQRRQQVRWRGESASSFSKVSSGVPLQVFLPSLSDLVFGGPGERRKWLDWGAFHVEHRYLEHWRSYTKCLQQRNALIKQASERQQLVRSPEFRAFTDAMIGAADAVTGARLSYLACWRPFFESRLQQLVTGSALAQMPELNFRPLGSSKSLSLQELLVESASRELKSGITVYGPHRADCELLLENLPLASAASRGQGKLIALAMMIAQADVIADRTGVSSVFLMDDLDAELDEKARSRLYQALSECRAQVFITGVRPGPDKKDASPASLPDSYALFHVKQGSVTQETV